MKYLKLFENKVLNISIVKYWPNGDGVTALYLNGILEFYSDSYHYNVTEYIQGMKDMLEYINYNYTINYYEATNKQEIEDVIELAHSPKTNLYEVEKKDYRNYLDSNKLYSKSN